MEEKNKNALLHKMKLKEERKIEYYFGKKDYSLADEMAVDEAQNNIAIIDKKLELEKPIERGMGNEIVPPSDSGKDGMALTVRKEDATTVQASIERVELANDAGVYNLAFDAAEAIQAQNPMEQMLAHQMAASHKHAMDLLAKSSNQITVERQTMLVNSATKLMSIYQKSLLTMHKLKNKNEQKITVQHVNIHDNAQAIVNPTMKGGGKDGG